MPRPEQVRPSLPQRGREHGGPPTRRSEHALTPISSFIANTPICFQCTSEPFAVVTRVWNHTDQSVPASKRSLLGRRDGPQMLVQGINLSTDFAATNTSQYVLSFAFV